VADKQIALSASSLGAFFDASHVALEERLLSATVGPFEHAESALPVTRALGALGLLSFLVPEARGGAKVGKPEDKSYIDVRSLVLIRERLGQTSGLADAIFAVQGLGSYPIVLAGTDAQRATYLPSVIDGSKVAAFALTEPEAGSDVASLRTTATQADDGFILNGEKTLISNVPADHYIVFANADPSRGRKGISAFVVDAGTKGLSTERIPLSIPHPIGKVFFNDCRVAKSALLGNVGDGFRLAMETLDAFRISVGGAANGMASRALACSIDHVKTRRQFGAPLADQQMVKAYLAEMATDLEAGKLFVARASHKRDTEGGRVSVEAAMAKMFATEAAQRVIDKAVQLHGGMGVTLGNEVEALYREIRPLRIYEGTTEIQKLIIAKALLDG
jgi:acyl-CoA dehydrogenase